MTLTKRLTTLLRLTVLGGATVFATVGHAELAIEEPSLVKDARQTSDAMPSRASLDRLMDVLRLDEMIEPIFDAQEEMVYPMLEQMIDSRASETSPLSEDERDQVLEIVLDMVDILLTENVGDIVELSKNSFIDVAQSYYTQTEVDAQIDFYSSEVGQSILDKQTPIMMEYMNRVMPESIRIMDEKIAALMPDIERRLAEIE